MLCTNHKCNVKKSHKNFIALSLDNFSVCEWPKINPFVVPVGENCLYKLHFIAVENFYHFLEATHVCK
jgi:hypothetical protein